MLQPRNADAFSIMTASQAGSCFGSTYAEACRTFLEASAQLGLQAASYPHPLRGPGGEELATHVVRLGRPDAGRLLILVSGVHGLEGLAGSGCQVAWLRSQAPHALPEDTAVLLIHMLNPWGSAWRRRQTEDNVDLNRNFQRFGEKLPENPEYERLHEAVAGRDPAGWACANERVAAFRREEGEGAYAKALFMGQHEHPDGIGFGGRAPTWSNRTLHQILDDHAGPVQHTAVLDIHTGLGPYGHGTLLSTDAPGSPGLEMSRRLYGPAVIPFNHERKTPYMISGDIYSGIRAHLPGQVAALGVEFGTDEPEILFQLQIDDCRTTDPRNIAVHDAKVRKALQAFFVPASPDWLQSLCLRSLQLAGLALERLGKEGAASSLEMRA